jgi:hypothetical protein
MNETILEELCKPLPIKERKGTGGMMFKYIPNEYVIERMNKVFKGNWSTDVISKEIMEDQVVIEVLVTVLDSDTGVTFQHTGFSSQTIARYRDGVNQGKPVDLGNIFKSALAKAIVNACTRWEVGLFKEPENEVVPVVVPQVAAPTLPVNLVPVNPAPINPAPVNPPVINVPIPAPVPNIPVIPTQRVVTNSTTLTQAVPPAPINVPAPPAPVNVQVPPAAVLPTIPAPNPELVTVAQYTTPPVVAPVAPVAQPMVPPVPPAPPVINTIPVTPSVPFATQPTGATNISDVQCVALNGILDMQGIEYEVLATEAFQERGITKPIPNKEELNYDDAVVIIKYGNDKYRKR